MADLPVAKNLQFIVKISKYCNLRCNYCYEYPELGNRERMSLDQLRRMFEHISEYAAEHPLDAVTFIWHGGEPLLIPIDYYEQIQSLQKRILPPDLPILNSLQTNLTVLTDAHIAMLKDGRFMNELGVSFDVYGDQRVDLNGKLRTKTILRNLQRLIDHGINFGAIAVLSRDTHIHARNIYRFYDRLKIGCRVLPFYMSASPSQASRHALSSAEVTDALKAVFDEWLCSEHATPVHPLSEYIDYATAHLSGHERRVFDPERDQSIFMVDVDGSTWGLAEAYEADHRLGNVFSDGLNTILSSDRRVTDTQAAAKRMNVHCGTCPFFGACDGRFVADATAEQKDMLARIGCPVREMVGYIAQRIDGVLSKPDFELVET